MQRARHAWQARLLRLIPNSEDKRAHGHLRMRLTRGFERHYQHHGHNLVRVSKNNPALLPLADILGAASSIIFHARCRNRF
jgi:hypothetical protein